AETKQLQHVWCDGKAAHPATLDDYAAMSLAALELFEQTGDHAYIADAQSWCDILETDFADEARGGFFMTPATAKDLPLRPQVSDDTAVPAGNGLMVGVYSKLWQLTGDATARQKAEKTARAFSAINPGHFFSR